MSEMDEAMDNFQRSYVRTLLAAECGNVTKAAKRAGRTRAGFDRLLRKLGLVANDFRKRATVESA